MRKRNREVQAPSEILITEITKIEMNACSDTDEHGGRYMEIEINSGKYTEADTVSAEYELRPNTYNQACAAADPILISVAHTKAEFNRTAL